MITYKIGNVLSQKFAKPTIICHIVNTESKFGSGFAYAVLKKYPEVKQKYHDWYDVTMTACDIRDTDIPFMLGQVQLTKVQDSPELYLCQMIAQGTPGGNYYEIGKEKIYLRPIRLDSLRECLYNVAVVAKKIGADVVGPRFGSGLAKGKWDEEIVPIIDECLTAFGIDITIFDLE